MATTEEMSTQIIDWVKEDKENRSAIVLLTERKDPNNESLLRVAGEGNLTVSSLASQMKESLKFKALILAASLLNATLSKGESDDSENTESEKPKNNVLKMMFKTNKTKS